MSVESPDSAAPSSADMDIAGPAALYRQRCASGAIRPDPEQQGAVERLQQLHEALLHYRPEPPRRGWLARLGLAETAAAAPRGLYIWGPVGRGKSMLMDLFFDTAPVANKRRVHFHAFMLEVHDRMERERRAKTREPMPKVAADITAEAALLCFDEFQVNDIADAMILERLFRALLGAGAVIVATSNRRPDRLYEHGLQRDRFLPFIGLIEESIDIVELDSGRDYRLSRMQGKTTYHWPLDEGAHRALQETFAALTDNLPGKVETLTVKGRPLVVPVAARNVAWFDFASLCEQPLSAVDYLALADRFAAIIVEGIPKLGPRQRNAAIRFNILIDTLYEARTLVIASAEVSPDQLYTEGDGSFEFRRTVSRLMEMQSDDYISNRRLKELAAKI